MKNLPTELLRTFVTVADLGGFTSAGEVLGRTQPAISLQIKRLEDIINAQLFTRDGRQLSLTAQGQALLDYSRRILSLNDDAIACLIKPQFFGHIRLGIPNEFANSLLPRILSVFTHRYPNITLEVSCQLSKTLLSELQQHEFDLVIALHDTPKFSSGVKLWTESLHWVTNCNNNKKIWGSGLWPIIAAPAPCVYRTQMVQVLNKHKIPWRFVYTGTSYGGICAAASAGLGMTVLAKSTVPYDLCILDDVDQLPELASVDVVLHYDEQRVSEAVSRLATHIVDALSGKETVKSKVSSM